MNCQPDPTPRQAGGGMLVLAVLVVMAVSLLGQQSPLGSVTAKDFKVPEYYPAPNQNQLKWLLTGSNAVPQDSITRVRLDHVTLETFKENGLRDVQLQADSCLFDSARRTVSSDGRLKMQTADGRMLIEGTGFCWQATNSSITISNQVHTIIKRTPAATQPDKP